jgi:hypothetical protein
MKSLFIITLFSLLFITYAQEETTSSVLICSNEEKSKWFAITPHFQEFNGISTKDYLTTIKLNIGKCSKRDVLTFTFVDGKYMNLRANNDLNCSVSEVNFSLNASQIAALKIKSIKSIRYTNGSDRSYFLYKLTGNDRNYFINLLKEE